MAAVNLKTAALRLGVHYQTAYRWVRSGQLVAVKVGAGYEISRRGRGAAASPASGDRADARARLRPRPVRRRRRVEHRRRVARARPDRRRGHARLDAPVGEHAAQLPRPSTSATPRSCTAGAGRRRCGVVYAAHRDPVSEVAASTLGTRSADLDEPRPTRASTTGELDLRRAGSAARAAPAPAPGAPRAPPALRLLQRGVRADRHDGRAARARAIYPVGRTRTTTSPSSRRSRRAVARADERARCWTGAWELRRAMVVGVPGAVVRGRTASTR